MAKDDEGKLFGFLAYLLGIIGFLIVLLAKKENKFAMYHAKQCLVLFIASIIAYIITMIPVIGWFVLGPILSIIILILWIIGMVNALTGKEKALPIIGKYAEKINL
jgi:uncharacterized membrane protein